MPTSSIALDSSGPISTKNLLKTSAISVEFVILVPWSSSSLRVWLVHSRNSNTVIVIALPMKKGVRRVVACRKRKGEQLVNDALSWPSRKKTPNPKVPIQLHSLVNKCPQWEDKTYALVDSNENHRHFSYKQMEQEITQREIVKTAWKKLLEKAENIVDRVQKRVDKLSEATSFPQWEQSKIERTIKNSVDDFRKLYNKFLFGGELYLRSRVTKCSAKGLLEIKESATRLRDEQLYEGLSGYLKDVTAFSTFLAEELPHAEAFLKEKPSIKRKHNLDLQAKGVMGASRRAIVSLAAVFLGCHATLHPKVA